MLSSPFQQPSPRQNALAQQIQEARTSGDQALLAGLISQWVHRYGFDGAAELDLSLPEPSASKHEFSSAPMPVAEEEIAPKDDVLVENEVDGQVEVVAEDEVVVEEEEQIAVEDDVLIESEVMQNGVVAEEETVVEDDESAAAKPLQRSFAAAPVPAPPISTPRSLRRWLPRREDDAFPKAS